jgi:hypothetical protein
MSIPSDHPYRKHSANARRVGKGLTQAERAHKSAIGGGDAVAIDFAARVHHMTVGLLAEGLLRKTIADPAGFNDRERKLLGQERSQLERWKTAVELSFRRQYVVPIHLTVDASSTSPAIASQYNNVLGLLDVDLAEIIEDRNKIAHGQWAWLLNSKETRFKAPAPPPLNYRAIEVRSKLVREIDALIRDLVVSEPTFARDYKVRYDRTQSLKADLDGSDYSDLVTQLKNNRRKLQRLGETPR